MVVISMQKLILVLILSNFILLNAEIKWADKLLGFSSERTNKEFSAMQILGEPSIMLDFGESPSAWHPKRISDNTEWLKVGFNNPIRVSQIAIVENYYPGAIISIYLYDSLNQGFRVYENNKPLPKDKRGRIFRHFITKTDYKVYALKVELSFRNYLEPYQIDAIAVSDKNEPITFGIDSIKYNQDYSPENLGLNINSAYGEIAPIISADGNTLYYTRDSHPFNTGSDFEQDIWFSTADSTGKFEKANNIGFPLNNKYSNYVISVTPDNNLLLVGGIFEDSLQSIEGLALSERIGDTWSFPKPLEIHNYYNQNPTASFNISGNSKELLMSVKRLDSYGGTDLYVSFLKEDSSFSEPLNLGDDINTASNEIAPFLASDGVTLYFATSGRPGFGEIDMFISKRLDDTWQNWSKPRNLGSLINTKGWDAYYTLSANGNYAYYVSTEDSYGGADIFRIKLPKELQPESVTLIKGKVLNKNTKLPLKANIFYEILSENKNIGIARSDPESGKYSIVLPNGEKYGFLAEAEGFLSINQNINLTNSYKYNELTRDIYLVPIEKGEKISLNNIFFKFAEFELLKESYNELNRLVELLNNNPKMQIQINGHTDNIGSITNNYRLSLKRANSVAEYLIDKGINKNRIKVKGFGETKPIVDNKSESGRTKNRRVEFEILKK